MKLDCRKLEVVRSVEDDKRKTVLKLEVRSDEVRSKK